MQIRKKEESLVLSDFEPFVLEILRRIAEAADPHGDPDATNRLFQRPVETREEPLCSEWTEYVHPDLRHLFATSVEIVQQDLRTVEGNRGILEIAPKHFEPWLNALNQARLSLCERYKFSEEELESAGPDEISSQRELALFQIHFYGFLQEIILRVIDGSVGAEVDFEEE